MVRALPLTFLFLIGFAAARIFGDAEYSDTEFTMKEIVP